MELYFSPGACSLATHIALNAGNIAHDRVKVDLKAKTTEQGEDYRTINPKGYVPALEIEDGALLTENIALLSYVGSLAPALFPPDGMAHWRTLETLAFISTELHKSFKPLFNPASSEAEKDEAKKTLRGRFDLIEPMLNGRPFLNGDAIGVTDCYLFVTLFWAKEKFGMELSPTLAGYFSRMREQPAVAQALKEEGIA